MNTTANNELVPVIDQQKDLTHLNALVLEINGLKDGFKDLTIEGPEDKIGYEKVRAAIAVLRPKRTGLEGERKSVVKPYNDFVKHINGQYEKITTLIQDGPGGELELKEKKDAIDEILERDKEAKRLEEEKKINDRINEILKYMSFDGSYYSIKDEALGISETNIGVVEIRTMSEELFQQFLQMVVEKHSKIAAEKERVAELERKAKEEKDAADKAEREEFEKQKANMERLQKEMQDKENAIKEQQEKLDQAKRDAEMKEKQVEQARVNNIIRHRSAVLTGIELEYNANNGSFDYKGEIMIADAASIADYEDVEWIEFLDKLKAIISNKKFQAEEFLKKQQQEEKEKLALQEKERLAGLSDKQKMQEYLDALLAVPVPPLTTKTWKARAGSVRDYLTDNRPA